MSFQILPLLLLAALPAAVPPSSPEPALARARVVLEQAVEQAPAARALRAELAAEAEGLRAEAAPAAPMLAWQREGLDGSLDNQPNAIEYLRLSRELAWPAQRRQARGLRALAGEGARLQTTAALAEVAGAAGRGWLALAAESARRDLAARRLERLEKILVGQRKRLELGEIAGTEVTQLELERLRELSRLRGLESGAQALAEQLRALAGELPLPEPADLETLAAATGRAEIADVPAALERGALLAAVRARAATAEAQSALARATAWGRPEAEIEWERVPALGGVDGFDAFGLRLGVPLPLGKQGAARRAQAELATEAARARAESEQRALETRARSVLAAEQSAGAVLAEISPMLERLPAAEHSLAEQYRLGAITYLVLIDGLSRLDEVRLEAIDAHRRLLEARLELALLFSDPAYFPLPALVTEVVP